MVKEREALEHESFISACNVLANAFILETVGLLRFMKIILNDTSELFCRPK